MFVFLYTNKLKFIQTKSNDVIVQPHIHIQQLKKYEVVFVSYTILFIHNKNHETMNYNVWSYVHVEIWSRGINYESLFVFIKLFRLIYFYFILIFSILRIKRNETSKMIFFHVFEATLSYIDWTATMCVDRIHHYRWIHHYRHLILWAGHTQFRNAYTVIRDCSQQSYKSFQIC